jgi:LacI family transcriptional regulator
MPDLLSGALFTMLPGMAEPLNIPITQVWSLGLAQEIGRGALEYARTHRRWKCSRPEYSLALNQLEQWRPDGLIITGPFKNAHERFKNVPYPVVMTHWAPELPELMQVDSDPLAAGAMAAEHLLVAGGYKHVACCFYPESIAHKARAEGFVKRAKESGITPTAFETVNRYSATESFITWLRSVPKPAAVFCTDDATARETIRAVRETGFVVPDDIAVLGCEDDEMICDSSHPAISSVRLPYRKTGYEAARMLDHAIRHRPLKKKQLYLPPEGITVRMSTSVFATGDKHLRRALEFIRRHACENITVHDAARHAGLSLRMMQLRFHQEVGHTPAEEIQRARMDKVKELLRNTEMTLTEIAEISGYQSSHYLSHIFKQINGRSARDYRNEFRRI